MNRIGDAMSQKTLLVVDDEATIRTILVQVFKQAGYRVLCASNGVQAMEVVNALPDPIDVLITDMTMPLMEGDELIERATAVRPGLKVICLSAAFSAVSLEKSVLFLPKPFGLKAVVSLVRSALEGTAQLRQVISG